jgi:predicted RNA binding protein YcfA (HicA-like mRNA interferase family)
VPSLVITTTEKAMPIKLHQLEQFASNLGFYRSRQRGSHVRWKHPDGRATTIPVYPEIGGWLLNEILHQLGATKNDLNAYQQTAIVPVSQLVK